MNRDLLDGALALESGKIRHLRARRGRRVEVLTAARSGSPRTATSATSSSRAASRSSSRRAATRCSAPSTTHAISCSTPGERATEPVPFSASGTGSAKTSMPSSRSASASSRRRLAADAALLDLAVVDAARLLREALADVLGVRRALAHRAQPLRLQRRLRVVGCRAGASGSRRRRDVQARRARQARHLAVAAHRALRPARARRCDTKSSSDANQPSKRWLVARSAGSGPSWRALSADAASGRRAPLAAASARRANSAARACRSASWRRSARRARASVVELVDAGACRRRETRRRRAGARRRRGRARTRSRCLRRVGDGVVERRRRAPIRRAR